MKDFLVEHIFWKQNRIKFIFSLVLAFINAVCVQSVQSHACFGWDTIGRYQWRWFFFYSFIAAYIFLTVMDVVFISKDEGNKARLTGIKARFVLGAFFFICWLPYLIRYAPGLVNYDTVNQVLDFFNGVSSVPFGYVQGQEEVTVLFNAHHPVFVTLIFGAFIKLGVLLGSPAKGLTIYIVLQMMLATGVLACCIEKISEIDEGRHIRTGRGIVLFFAVCPIIPYYTCNMLKNSLHTIFCVAYVFLYLMITMTDHNMSKTERLCWIAIVILLTLTQNTGVYFVIITGLFLALKSKVNRNTIISGVIVSALLMFILLPKIIYPAFNIFPGGKQEILGTLFQQTARFVRDYEEEVTENDVAVLSRVVDYNVLKDQYNFDTTDDLKATYNLHATREELLDFMKLWARWGIKHPDSYFRAILPICGQFFAMGYNIGIFDHIPTDEGIFAQIRHVRPEEEFAALSGVYYWARSFPGIDILFQHALYVLWIPAYCLYRQLLRKKTSFVFIVPFIVNMLFVIVSPLAYSRYALPLIFTSPILLYYTAAAEN